MFAYIGGKSRQSKWINSFIPKDITTYGEVFGGAFWPFIKSSRTYKNVFYNDINRFNVNVFSCLQYPKEFLKFLNSVEPQKENIFNEYKEKVLEFENVYFEIPNFELAHMYMYIITQTFSGIMSKKVKMINLKGKYRSKFLSFRDRVQKKEIQEKLKDIIIHNFTYSDIIPLYDNKETLLYLDPPYYDTENLYEFHSFTRSDHFFLAEVLKSIESKWILSYYEFPSLSEWFPKDIYRWEEKEYSKASMASKNKSQTKGKEVLILNY